MYFEKKCAKLTVFFVCLQDGSSSTSGSDTSAPSWSLNSYLGSCPTSAAAAAAAAVTSSNSLLPQDDSLILKDRLLTDPMLFGGGDEPLVAVKHEHSYSISNSCSSSGSSLMAANGSIIKNEAGSDGDSVPASPVSLQDGRTRLQV